MGPGCQPEIEAVEGETSVAQMDMVDLRKLLILSLLLLLILLNLMIFLFKHHQAMELLRPLIWLNPQNLLLVQECPMEPEDLLWEEADLFLHLQANDVLLSVFYCKYNLMFRGLCCYVKNAWMMNFNGWCFEMYSCVIELWVPGDSGI